jgi:hypothetical protein
MMLADYNWIAGAGTDTTKGGRPTIRYTINPKGRQ